MRTALRQVLFKQTLLQRVMRLFSQGEQGLWLDPSDFSTLFQDSAGTTPVTAVEQPVGKILDKSGRGNHATQATSVSRPILRQDANGKYYLFFDGIDDSLATAAINFTSTDKMTVFAGVRKLSDAASGILLELGVSPSSAAFNLAAPSGAAANYAFRSGGSVFPSSVAVTTYTAPITNVLCCIGGIAEDIATTRVNGAQAGVNAADQGTGNYANAVLYIGRRGGTTLPFNGRLYSLIVRGAQSSDSQIVSAESYVNSKTGAY